MMNSLQDRRLTLETKVHRAMLKVILHKIVKPSFLGWAFCSWHGRSGKNAWRHRKTKTCTNDHPFGIGRLCWDSHGSC